MPLRTRRGVTLLEALVALVLVGATATAALASADGGVRATERARRAHETAALAEERLVALTLLPADALRALHDSLRAGRFAPPFEEYAWQAEVVPDAVLPGLHRISVTISWADGAWSVSSATYRPEAAVAPPRATRRGQRG